MISVRRCAAAALGAAAVAASLVPVAPTYAAGIACQEGPGPCVIVRVLDGQDNQIARHEFSADDLWGQDSTLVDYPDSQPYTFRHPSGEISPVDPHDNVVSVANLVVHTPMDLAGVHYVEVFDDPAGFISRLSHDDLANPGRNFQDGLVPGLYRTDGVGYSRPLRGDTDVNSRDYFDTGGALEVDVHTTGALLNVSATATATKVMAGQPLTLTATVHGSDGVPPYAYDWDFAYRDSTQPTTGRTITHHWKDPGTYYVSVSVTDSTAPHANHGQSNFVPITVTCNPKTDPDRCGKTQKPPKPPKTPCTACTGNEQGGHHPRTGPSDGRGHHSPDGTGRHDSPTGGPDGRHATGGPTGGNGPDVHTSGLSVSGRLLVASQSYTAPRQRQAATEVSGARVPSEQHWTWPWKFSAVLLLPLLLGLGMAGEAVQVRRRVARMRA